MALKLECVVLFYWAFVLFSYYIRFRKFKGGLCKTQKRIITTIHAFFHLFVLGILQGYQIWANSGSHWSNMGQIRGIYFRSDAVHFRSMAQNMLNLI